MNCHHTYLFAFSHERVDGFLGGLGRRTHHYDYTLGIGCAVVVEQVIFAACDGADFGHVVLNDIGYSLIVLVAGLAVLEENVAVLGHAACHGLVGGKGAVAEFSQGLTVEQRLEVFLLEGFYFLGFRAKYGIRRRS